MIRRPPRSTRTDTLLPYTTLFRSPLIAQLPNFIIQWGYARSSLIQLDGILGLPQDHPAETANLRPESLQGQIRLDRVAFVYPGAKEGRSEEHTSELQSLMRISYAVFCLTKKKQTKQTTRAH